MVNLEEMYRETPIITRTYTTLALITTIACTLDIVNPLNLYLNTTLIVEKLQVWRLLTNFLYFGNFGLDFFFHIFFLVRYSRNLEDGCFRGRSADFFFMLLFGAVILILVTVLFSIPIHFLGSSLTFMMVYVWGKRNQDIQIRFVDLMTFTAPWLPWVLLGFSLLLKNNPIIDLLGIAAGHIYYFLEDVYPQLENGRRVLKTPRIIQMMFSNDTGEIDLPDFPWDQNAAANNPQDDQNGVRQEGTGDETQTETQTENREQHEHQD